MDEVQFILRLPQGLAEKMQFALGSKVKEKAAKRGENVPSFSIKWLGDREAVFVTDGVHYPATLLDLPVVCETHKTPDKKTFFKSGDVHQVLQVRNPNDPHPTHTLLKDGITKAAKKAAIRLAPVQPAFTPELVSNVENQLKIVLDKKIAFVQKADDGNTAQAETIVQTEEVEIVEEEQEHPAGAESAKKDLKRKQPYGEREGDKTNSTPKKEQAPSSQASDSSAPAAETIPKPRKELAKPPSMPVAAPRKDKTAAARAAPSAEKPPAAAGSKPKTLAAPPTKTGGAPQIGAPPTQSAPPLTQAASPLTVGAPVASSPSAMSPQPSSLPPSSPQAASVSAPSPQVDTPGEDEADQDALADARKRGEIVKQEKLVKDQEKIVKAMEEQLEKQGNPIMKKRLQAKLDAARLVLDERKSALEALTNP